MKSQLLAFGAALVFGATVSAAEQTNTSSLPTPGPIAEGDYRPHVALLAGVADPEGNYDATAEYGLDIGYQPYIPFGVGAILTFADHDRNGAGEDLERTTVLARGTYNFGGSNYFVRNSYVGVALGVVFEDGDTNLASAPIVGFDLPLAQLKNDYLSIGATAKYLAIADNPDAFTLDGVLKYWY